MSTQVQYRRGTGAENNSFTGALGEITVDTTNWTLRIHNGIAPGGAGNLATVAYVTEQLSSLSSNSISFGTSSVSVIASNGNVQTNVGGTTITTEYSGGMQVTGVISASGDITGGNIIAVGTVKGANIDSVNADLAERYVSDAEYMPGTVVVFGGDKEITQSTSHTDTRIAGVISTAPAYCMNADAPGQAVALMGRVPCRVIGSIRKGDLLVSSQLPGVATVLDHYQPGCVIGKALENYNSEKEGIAEIVVGRL